MTKNITIVAAAVFLLALVMAACDNTIAKRFGGTMAVEIEKDQKLVNCSWKSGKNQGDSLWLLTRVRKEGELPETYKYSEKSTFGVLEGTVTIVEK
jgi:hypothetical protein